MSVGETAAAASTHFLITPPSPFPYNTPLPFHPPSPHFLFLYCNGLCCCPHHTSLSSTPALAAFATAAAAAADRGLPLLSLPLLLFRRNQKALEGALAELALPPPPKHNSRSVCGAQLALRGELLAMVQLRQQVSVVVVAPCAALCVLAW